MNLQARIELEKRIARKVVRALLAAGYEITVNNGGDDDEIPYSSDFAQIIGAMFATDEECLRTCKDDHYSFVRFVYGNDGWDVVNDYGTSLQDVMEPINEYCEKIAAR
jgi:hypothetical protein